MATEKPFAPGYLGECRKTVMMPWRWDNHWGVQPVAYGKRPSDVGCLDAPDAIPTGCMERSPCGDYPRVQLTFRERGVWW